PKREPAATERSDPHRFREPPLRRRTQLITGLVRHNTIGCSTSDLGHFRPTLPASPTVGCLLFPESGLISARQRRLRVGKKKLHFAAMVGAAMFSACLRGTRDRWP